jgi:hypothetical protein
VKAHFAALAALTSLVAVAVTVACGTPVEEPPADGGTTVDGALPDGGVPDGALPPAPPELPWEVVSEQGETYLPNMFYADNSQTEQVMPLAIDGRLFIDRLVYPTIGNPNLYVKDDPKDSMMAVLRIEQSVLDAYGAKETRPVPGHARNYLDLTQDAENYFAFYLVARDGRIQFAEFNQAIPGADGLNVVRIDPSEMQIDPITPDMPESLKARRTVRVLFRGAQMAQVPPALYDLRFEAKRSRRVMPAPSGNGAVYEWQYNAVRVFASTPANDTYNVLNITDTQYSLGAFYAGKTKERLDDLVDYVNLSTDPKVRNAAFITFNGDLHNSGSPTTLRLRAVANTYNDEAKGIVERLKYLRHPIFLTMGNHDAYNSTGVAPGAVESAENTIGASLEKVTNDAAPKAWPNYSWAAYKAYLDKLNTIKRPGGFELDLFSGSFQRFAGARTFADGWREIVRDQRNMVLYDGYNQWARTYGPHHSSFLFGKNFYMNLNSAEQRQHTRSGWGMYTVSYGGAISDVQMEWIRRDMDAHPDHDIVLLAHHDPRGGHNGKDSGYYFAPLAYKGMGQSTVNYVIGEIWNPQLCKLPSWAISDVKELGCLHDGLQEWMGPDTVFDCGRGERKADGRCNADLFKQGMPNYYRFSAFDLVDLIATHPRVRTFLLGHTHYNSFEMLQSGDEIVPANFTDLNLQNFANLEVQNPSRGYAWQQETTPSGNYDPDQLQKQLIQQRAEELRRMYEGAIKNRVRFLGGEKRELAVLRTTSVADLASQTYQGNSIFGFSVLGVAPKQDARGYALPQINTVTYIQNQNNDKFAAIYTMPMDRTKKISLHGANNPLTQVFAGEPGR